ncbi:Transcription elongation factor spt-6 [Rhynchospora pubera]|uniref:Transcription elongation factor spt-6 n=1 Tax=Rhynchospora pubera TaxID=906938 RepID=A0AAV8FG31_9POAL|nr:Transcription elongation factor spt-6 [Rhynchospora pubera]
MLEMNATIREFQQMAAQTASKQHSPGLPLSTGEVTKPENSMPDAEESFKGLQENFKCINAEMQMLEAEYEKQLHEHTEVSKELENLRRKRILVAAIIEESKLLQELAGYPLFTNDVSFFQRGKKKMVFFDKNKQTIELEREYASLGEELEKRSACPSCGFNNMAILENLQH